MATIRDLQAKARKALVKWRKDYAGDLAKDKRSPVSHLCLTILLRNNSVTNAQKAEMALRTRFVDWNEIRVSSPREIAEAIGDILPDADARGQRMIDFLQEVFETTFSFDLEALQKKGVKQAAKQLARYQAANDYVVAWVVQHSLGGHALALRRVGLGPVVGPQGGGRGPQHGAGGQGGKRAAGQRLGHGESSPNGRRGGGVSPPRI